ncbi:MAG: type I-E CRISPR-associated protein Cas6/Cse3/CasE [Solirubrobacteraceae bacterium]|nr:type I-E CRISPR-associated protein Cas6/Cse3/CasE [Solirubrobacteraceae bacterium]
MSLYLSRLRLHPRDPLVVRDLGDVVGLHRTLMRGFPQYDGPDPRAALGVLFRVESALRRDPHEVGAPHEVLVQSVALPDWSGLPEGYALSVEVRDARDLVDAVTVGRRFRFRLLGNATRKTALPRPGKERPRHSRRVPLDNDDERRAWVENRAAGAGFELIDGAGGLRVDVLPPLRQPKRAGGVTVRPVLYEGRLEVRDEIACREALRTGIGPAKAYGCGLLSLAPA